MSTFMISTIMMGIAFVLFLSSWFFTTDYYNKKRGKHANFVVMVIMIVIAFLLVAIANINIYLNGTELEIIKWMFWV